MVCLVDGVVSFVVWFCWMFVLWFAANGVRIVFGFCLGGGVWLDLQVVGFLGVMLCGFVLWVLAGCFALWLFAFIYVGVCTLWMWFGCLFVCCWFVDVLRLMWVNGVLTVWLFGFAGLFPSVCLCYGCLAALLATCCA